MYNPTLNGNHPKERLPEDNFDLIKAPTKLFHPYRLLIMKTLKLHGNVEFRQLKYNIPDITDGNLASHLGVLEKLGYIQSQKEIENRKLRTSYEITKKGMKDYQKLMIALKKLMNHETNI